MNKDILEKITHAVITTVLVIGILSLVAHWRCTAAAARSNSRYRETGMNESLS
jgi:hypothetical protein